jgi:hypothetical protein
VLSSISLALVIHMATAASGPGVSPGGRASATNVARAVAALELAVGPPRVPPESPDVPDPPARRLAALAKALVWPFPTSAGRPVAKDAPAAVVALAERREVFVRAQEELLARGEVALATEVAAGVWRVWVLARDDGGGRAFLAPLLNRTEARDSRAYAHISYGDGLLAWREGDLVGSRTRNDAALAAARAVHDIEAEVLALLGQSRVELSEGQASKAYALAMASRAGARELTEAYGQAPLHMAAQAALRLGPKSLDQAASLFRESLALNRRLGDQGMVEVELHNLGHAEVRRGHIDEAERLFAECAAMAPGGDDAYGAAMLRFNQATIANARGDRVRARALLEMARGTLTKAGISPADDDALALDALARDLAGASGER